MTTINLLRSHPFQPRLVTTLAALPGCGSPVARRVAIRLEDYLREVDETPGSLAGLWPLAARLPATVVTPDLERRRVRICLAWAMAIVAPATSCYLNLKVRSTLELMRAGRTVRDELSRAAYFAGHDTPEGRDASVSYVWNAVFAAFTLGHTRPLVPDVQAVLASGHELLARLVDLVDATGDAVLTGWTPIWLTPPAAEVPRA